MKTTAHRRHLSTWVACLAVLGSTPTWAQAQVQAGGQVFIQGSEVNLRDKPATTAQVVAKVAIGAECLHVKAAPKQWVRIKCGEAEGFTLKSLVGAEKPSLDALLAQAQDTTLSAKVRLDAAMRAATLDLENEQALTLLAERFFDVHFEQLVKDRKQGGLHEAFVVKREIVENREGLSAEQRKETGEEGLLRELEKIEYDWHRFQLRGNDFVSAVYRDGALVVYTGSYLSMNRRYALEEDQEKFQVIIESRSNSAVSDALKAALQQGARTPEARKQKYSSFDDEYPGMPILSPETFRLLRSLHSRWHLIAEEAGERFIRSSCGWVYTRELRFDLHRRATLASGDAGMGPDGSFGENEQVVRISDVIRNGATHTFRFRTDEGKEYTQTLLWPTGEPGVGVWQSGAEKSSARAYAAAQSRGIEVRELCNSISQ
ncbi:SH3 domain-containing protein [Pyxidicoccus xibeiensis]|uniref:SH3 domain-containing protein n=1 Tax=Pyxidicoccus xibeiensis TaxID=2906759 RepID=UPI0020A77480|nr:SH3 domain-containing protein [Pyxidicoccus xibeiensis]MCP3142998.1 hypothetical protein [Pyxidicoccus xibeiensis]